MNAWIRPLLIRGHWHLQVMVTANGLRVAHCGVCYPPSDELETSALEAAAALDTCEICYAAYRRSSRVIPI